MCDSGTEQEIKIPWILLFLKIKAGTMFYLTTITVSCNKKGLIPIQTTQSNLEFFMPCHDAYYHAY